jgi:hypothetical protein
MADDNRQEMIDLRQSINLLNTTIEGLQSEVKKMNERLDKISENTKDTVTAVKENTQYTVKSGNSIVSAVDKNTEATKNGAERVAGVVLEGSEARRAFFDQILAAQRQQQMANGGPGIAKESLNADQLKHFASLGKTADDLPANIKLADGVNGKKGVNLNIRQRRTPDVPTSGEGPASPQME